MRRLGTETAFAVSAEAAALKAQGQRVYPFHLGDMNMPTPPNIIEAAAKAMRSGKTGYCPASGITELREAVAQAVGEARGVAYGTKNVCVQPGGKPVIGKFIMSLMEVGDEVLYPNPGYPIYESQIEFHGGVAVPYGFIETSTGFTIDLEKLRSLITPKTRLLIYNNLENPLAAESTRAEMLELAEVVCEHDLMVLSDEAYFEIRYGGQSSSIVSLPGLAPRTVILYTFSKKFAMTGWRLGAAVGPEHVIEDIARLSVNDESCTNQFIQWAGIEALQGDQSHSEKVLEVLRQRRDVAVDLLNALPGVQAHRPDATFYLFPNVTEAVERTGVTDIEEFRKLCLQETGVSFCTRRHFGRELPGEANKYIRLAYSGIGVPDIEEGLGKLREFLERRA